MNYQPVGSNGLRTTELKDQLQTLRQDFKQLVKMLESLASDTGNAMSAELQSRLDRFAAAIDEAVADASGRGREAVNYFNDLGSSARHSVEDAVRERPLGTIALAAAAGFVLSAFVRR